MAIKSSNHNDGRSSVDKGDGTRTSKEKEKRGEKEKEAEQKRKAEAERKRKAGAKKRAEQKGGSGRRWKMGANEMYH